MSLTIRFDATREDFEAAVQEAYAQLSGDTTVIGLHMPADDEEGELVSGNAEPTREVQDDDWYVVGSSVQAVVAQIEKLIQG